jgi:hypothetical protein
VKPIRLSRHAEGYIGPRGFSFQEVEMAIREKPWQATGQGPFECRKDFPFDAIWNNRRYATKQVRPIFVEEAAEIVVITVYTYYF